MTVYRGLTGATLSVLCLGAIACSSSVEPSQSVTLQVTNQTCSPGPCTTLQILAFPSNQPNTPGGLWSLDLGVVTAASACLTIPANATFRVTGSGATTTYTWTSAIPLSVGTLLPAEPRLQARPSTGTFVPRSASGWSVTLPGDSRPTPSGVCDLDMRSAIKAPAGLLDWKGPDRAVVAIPDAAHLEQIGPTLGRVVKAWSVFAAK